jgi:hypothetical protein
MGTRYELYRVPLLAKMYRGRKFQDLCLILYEKLDVTLIAIEVKVGNQTKVFVNPSDYILDDCDYYVYCIHHRLPDFTSLNYEIDLDKENAENFFIMDQLNQVDVSSLKSEQM